MKSEQNNNNTMVVCKEPTNKIEKVEIKDDIHNALAELDLNIAADVAFLAGFCPPVRIFPTPNTTNLPFNQQAALLESEYVKHYAFRGDLKYNENMARAIKKTNPVKGNQEDNDKETTGYRVCRDKARFLETRTKDDAVILRKILSLMIVRTSEMEKHLEKILADSGMENLPNWDKIFDEEDGVIDQIVPEKKKVEEKKVKKIEKPAPKDEKTPKVMGAAKRKRQTPSQMPKATPKSKVMKLMKLVTPIPEIMTRAQAQSLVAHMLITQKERPSKRVHPSSQFLSSIVQISDQEADKLRNRKQNDTKEDEEVNVEY